jgi:plastocyanin
MQHRHARASHAGTIGAATITAIAAALALGACGDDDEGDGGLAEDADLTVVAQDTLTFDRGSYEAEAGELTIGYENGGNLTHTLLIEGVDGFELEVNSQGDTDAGTVELEAGEHRIYCDIPGHERMEATLTVG